MEQELREVLDRIEGRITGLGLRLDGIRHDLNASSSLQRKEQPVAAYSKFVVALVGFAVVIAHNQGVDIAEDVSAAAITLLTALGVLVVPNR